MRTSEVRDFLKLAIDNSPKLSEGNSLKTSIAQFLTHTIFNLMLVVWLAGGAAAWAQQAGATKSSPNDAFGSGGHSDFSTDVAGAVLQGTVYDGDGEKRETSKESYTADNGKPVRTEEETWGYNPKGMPEFKVDMKFNLDGGLKYFDETRYGLRGERSWELRTEYKPTGTTNQMWNSLDDSWLRTDTPYKTTTGGGLTTSMTNLGVLCPRDWHPGDWITCRVEPQNYAKFFTGIPGMSEQNFSVPMLHLPDGTPEWPSLQMGVAGDGYAPVDPTGQIALHLPLKWSGDLKLQVEPYGYSALNGYQTGMPGHVVIDMGAAKAAPELPKKPEYTLAERFEIAGMKEDLIDVWNEIYDTQNLLDYIDASDNFDGYDVDEIMDYLDDLCDERDDLIDDLPKGAAAELANELAQETGTLVEKLDQGTLTAEEKSQLQKYQDWKEYLEDESKWIKLDEEEIVGHLTSLDWTLPVQPQGKLGGIHGDFGYDPSTARIRLDGIPVSPFLTTPTDLYYLPPDNLGAGEHNLAIDSPGMPEMVMPIFYMTLTMSADQLHLHKGQSTAYHVTLSGLNGLPTSAWGSSFFPSDLVDTSELGSFKLGGMPGSSQSGTITLSVTNGSPDVITMVNEYRTLDAKMFAPSGSFHIDGVLGSIRDGNFIINGVARAYLDPVAGFGAGLSLPQTQMPSYDQPWIPKMQWTPGMTLSESGTPPTMTLDTEEQNVTRDKQKAADADAKSSDAAMATGSAWQKGMMDLQSPDAGMYRELEKSLLQKDRMFRSSFGSYSTSPTAENLSKLESAQMERNEVLQSLDMQHGSLLQNFSAADQGAVKNAYGSFRHALGTAAEADSELRQSRNLLGKQSGALSLQNFF